MFGTRELPRYWPKYVYNDWARTKTKYHANVCGTVTVSPQNTRLPGCVFVFNPMSFNAGTSPEDVAIRLLKTISPLTVTGRSWEEVVKSTLDRGHLEKYVTDTTQLIVQRRVLLSAVIPKFAEPVIKAQNYQVFRCSHERTDVQKVFRTVFGLPFHGINPGSDGGTETLNLLQRVDYSLPHPVIPGKKGYTRFFLVVEDDLTRPCLIDMQPVTYGDGKIAYEPMPYRDTLTPDELQDDDLFRYQFKNWRLRDPYMTSKGEIEGDILKMNDDHGNGCFVAGTLIQTNEGERPIETIHAGDLVWTRAGLRRVIAAGYTGDKPTYSLRFSNGRALQGTATHPLWSHDSGWTDLCCFRAGDKIHSWASNSSVFVMLLRDRVSARLSSLAGFGFTVTQKAALQPTVNTSSHTFMHVCAVFRLFMLRFGSPLTGLFQRVLRFTTRTAITTIMIPITWSRSLHPSTLPCMLVGWHDPLSDWHTWPLFNLLAERGTQQRLGRNGTVSILRRLFGFLSKRIASSVATSTKRNLSVAVSVLSNAHGAIATASNDSVRVVTAPTPSGVRATYNLQVEGEPEYYANGVLVHNCMMLFYDGCVQALPLTDEEKFNEMVPAGYHKEEIAARADLDPVQKAMTRWFVEREVRRALKPKEVAVDDYGESVK